MRELTPNHTHLFHRKFGEMLEVVSGDGAYIYDREGNEYFDAVGGNQCSNIGHGVPAVADAAQEQIRRLEYASSMLFVTDQSQEFAEDLAHFLPDGFDHTWLVSGGSEANESAIKFAREYHRSIGNTEEQIIIGRRLSFHGNTLGTLSASGHVGRRGPFEPMLSGWPKAPAAYPYRCPHCPDTQTCREQGSECAKELETVIQDVGSEYVAGFIAEPIVGAANAACVPGDEYFPTIRDICDDNDVLFIADEVMSGMGRTGSNFAIEHWDVTPDIITSAKGMSAGYTPMGGMMPHRRLVEEFADHAAEFTHGHTFSFNPTSCAIGIAVLDYLATNDVISNARTVGEYTRDRFDEFADYAFVGDIRGRGLMLGIEFAQPDKTPLTNGGPEFREQLLHCALEHGLTVYPGGGTIDGHRGDHVLLTPPLTISTEQADEMITKLHQTFTTLRDTVLA